MIFQTKYTYQVYKQTVLDKQNDNFFELMQQDLLRIRDAIKFIETSDKQVSFSVVGSLARSLEYILLDVQEVKKQLG